MKKIISILLIVTMLLSMFVFVIPASATTTTTVTNNGDGTITVTTKDENDNVISTITVPNSVDIATGANTGAFLGATSQTKPGLSAALTLPGANDLTITGPTAPVGPTAPSLGTLPDGTGAGVSAPNVPSVTVPQSPTAQGATGVTESTPSVDMMITHVGLDGNDKTPVKLETKVEDGKTVVTNVGNVVFEGISAEDREAYQNSLKAAGYTPVGSFSELKSAHKQGGRVYLTASITMEGVLPSKDNGTVITDLIIDGCGYTINLANNRPMYNDDVYFYATYKNVTFTGEFNVSGDTRYFHIFDLWGKACVSLYNVTAAVDFNVSYAADNAKHLSAFSYVADNVEYKNVLNKGNISFSGTDCIEINNIAGLIGASTNGKFYSVVNAGEIFVDGSNMTTGKNVPGLGYVGGLVGKATNCTFTNCYNLSNITVQNVNNLGVLDVGGLVGYAQGSDFYNCVNAGDITVTGKADDAAAKAGNIGGITGQNITLNTDDYPNFGYCLNSGDITVEGIAVTSSIGGLTGYSLRLNSIDHCYNTGDIEIKSGSCTNVAGIIGYNNNEVAGKGYTYCINTGDITIDESVTGVTHVAGLMGRSHSKVQYCENYGDITVNCAATHIAGLVGFNWQQVLNSKNTGDVVVGSTSQYVGGVTAQIGGSSTSSDCINTGSITVNGATTWVGGVIGYIKSTANNHKNEGAIIVKSTSQYVGGVIGQHGEGAASGNINVGAVTVSGATSYVGGVVGWTCKNTTSAKNEGAVTVNATAITVGGVIGYNKAAGFMERMEADGIVSAPDANNKRHIL